MSKYIVEKFKDIEAYTPGEQPKLGEFIKLNTNESPFAPPLESSENLLEKVGNLNIYNDTNCVALTKEFAKYHDVQPENVIFGNGSDEILAFCFLAFCDLDHGIVYPEITYGFYKSLTGLYSVQAEKIPLNEDFTITISDYYNKNKTVLIANPNAPTGITLSPDDIEKIVQANPNNVVIIDEAYMGFGGESAVHLTKEYENLVITGTFSKSRNLAGARLGYAIANKQLISDLNNIRCSYNPYNVNSTTQYLGLLSIQNDEYYKKCTGEIANVREKFVDELDSLGFATLPSKANFIFTKHESLTGEQVYTKLREHKILVRYFSDEKTKNHVRISIGTAEQMNSIITALKKILEV
ncbi:MAG: histidinol-phosphate transaminase [Clostridia bacterium]